MKTLIAYLKVRDFLRDRSFLKDKSGATVIEYCLIAGLIVLGIIAWATSIGNTTNGTFMELNEGVWGA